MATSIGCIIDDGGRLVAKIEIQNVEDDWYYGRLISHPMPEGLRQDLEWYDEVVSTQMLSYLDAATAAVERHRLTVCLPDDTCHRVYSLNIDSVGEVSFRITPVPPPEPKGIVVSSVLT